MLNHYVKHLKSITLHVSNVSIFKKVKEGKKNQSEKAFNFLCGFDAILAYKLQDIIKVHCPILKK